AALEEVRRVRKENFDEHGADAERRQIVPGRSWAAWARALGHLRRRLKIADLGCGEGYLTFEAARFAKRVVAVDRSEAALERAREAAERRRAKNGGGSRWSAERAGATVRCAGARERAKACA